jgi:hypothetical protein
VAVELSILAIFEFIKTAPKATYWYSFISSLDYRDVSLVLFLEDWIYYI